MSEKIIQLEAVNPVEIFGVNDANLNLLKAHYPQLRIVARGDQVKIIGQEKEIDRFIKKFNLLMVSYDKFGKLTEGDIFQILEGNGDAAGAPKAETQSDVLVHGRNGLLVRARTPNQVRMVSSCNKNDMVFAIGPAGTGKTYTAVALAVRALKNREVKRIILARPAVEAGESLGFLPGDMRDKLDPYLQPLYDALRDMLPTQRLLTYLEDGTIEIAPLAYMRGRTLNNVFVILDEAQNATASQIKMFLTRMGPSAKFIVTGDITQIDLPRNQKSGLIHASNILQGIKGIDFVFLDEQDIVRHKLVARIIKAYSKADNSK